MSLDKLRSDYYGKEGKKYLSNSDIITLLKNPHMFGKEREKTLDMVKGSYLHTKILEPEKLDQFNVVDCSTRSTKLYKEAVPEGEIYLLKSEVDVLDSLVSKMISNMEIHGYIHDDVESIEEPATKTLFGVQWKGKADIVKSSMIVDIKTTSDIDAFKYSARKYNYDSQAWIYNQLFGKPMVFVVIDKNSGRMGVYDCSEEFLDYGREKVIQAVDVWNRFFGPHATENIEQFVNHLTL